MRILSQRVARHLVAILGFVASSISIVDPAGSRTTKSEAAMSEQRFWEIIEHSRRQDPAQQIQAISAELDRLNPGELVAWEALFDQQMRRSYRWDLWGAAYVAMGGASDDSFEYFRLWLISRGQSTFNKVLTDPDALSDIAPDNTDEMEFEEFAHIAPDIWARKTSKKWDEMPKLASFFDPAGYGPPKGQQFSEDPKGLAARYPKLWHRFAEAK